MRGQVILALGLVLSIFLSGCTSGDAKAAPSSIAPAPSATVTAETGSVSGTITDDEAKPVSGVTVALLEVASATTESDATGRFTINQVAPGTYSLVTQKLGYKESSARINVVAGEVTTKNILMTPIAIDTARQEQYQLDAYMQAGASTPVVTARPGILLNDKLIFNNDVAGGVLSLITAMAWESSAPLTAKKMRLDVLTGGSVKNVTNAKSPMMNIVEDCDDETRSDCSQVFKKKTTVQHSIWIPFTCPYTQPTSADCTSDPPSGYVVVVYEQRYKLYVTSFWGGVAPVDFTGLPP